MGIKLRLTVMNFLQFFIWGSWLLTIGAYWFQNKEWSASQFGIIFSTMGIAAVFMPALMGILSDRWVNAEKLYGFCHLGGAAMLFTLPQVNSPSAFFWIMLVNMMFYMPTLSLAVTVAYTALKNTGKDVVSDFPPIRIWGTIGFIAALWLVSLTHNETSSNQFYIASFTSFTLGLYAFSLPKCPPLAAGIKAKIMAEALGLNAFNLLKDKKFAVFFVFSMLLGAALQLTNAYGNPADGLWMIVLSCVVYGMAFDFFSISGSLFIETNISPQMRGSAQGLFTMMVNGFGALIGSFASGIVIQVFFTNEDVSLNWQGIWLCFAGYALVLVLIFSIAFRERGKLRIR